MYKPEQYGGNQSAPESNPNKMPKGNDFMAEHLKKLEVEIGKQEEEIKANLGFTPEDMAKMQIKNPEAWIEWAQKFDELNEQIKSQEEAIEKMEGFTPADMAKMQKENPEAWEDHLKK